MMFSVARSLWAAVHVLAIITCCSTVYAQEPVMPPPVDVEEPEPFDPMAIFSEMPSVLDGPNISDGKGGGFQGALDKLALEKRLAMQVEFYDSEVSWRNLAMGHRQRTFEWQLFSSKVVFWMVFAIVAVGLWFSGYQLFGAPGSRRVQQPLSPEGSTDVEAKTAQADAEAANHEFTAELGPLKLSATSPVLGVIVLVISIVFFFLYLDRVYPIREIGGS